MCRGHIYVRMCPYTRVCYPHTCVHTYTNFARVYVSCFHMLVQFVCVRVCVLPSEMECVLFYSRKIAHRANVICCIMYPTLNKCYLILSYLILPSNLCKLDVVIIAPISFVHFLLFRNIDKTAAFTSVADELSGIDVVRTRDYTSLSDV